MFQRPMAKVTAAKAETQFVEAGLKILIRQTKIRAQNERFSVADHNVQPLEQAGILS